MTPQGFSISAVAFAPSGLLVYVLTNSQILTVPVWGNATLALAGLASISGSCSGCGFADGQGTAARFSNASGLVVHPVTGVVYIADSDNFRIRTCTATGLVATLAGSGTIGNVDGAASTATFNGPFGIVMDSANQYIYVTCKSGGTLRQVDVTAGFTTTLVSGLSSPTYEIK